MSNVPASLDFWGWAAGLTAAAAAAAVFAGCSAGPWAFRAVVLVLVLASAACALAVAAGTVDCMVGKAEAGREGVILTVLNLDLVAVVPVCAQPPGHAEAGLVVAASAVSAAAACGLGFISLPGGAD